MLTPRENRMRLAALRAEDGNRPKMVGLGSPPTAAALAALRRAKQPKQSSGRRGELRLEGKLYRARTVA